MTWNYRIVKSNEGFSVYEVFYDENGELNGITKDPILGFYCETPDDILEELEIIKKAIKEPILNIEDISGE